MVLADPAFLSRLVSKIYLLTNPCTSCKINLFHCKLRLELLFQLPHPSNIPIRIKELRKPRLVWITSEKEKWKVNTMLWLHDKICQASKNIRVKKLSKNSTKETWRQYHWKDRDHLWWDPKPRNEVICLFVWLVEFNCISNFVGNLMPNPFFIQVVQFQTNRFSISTQFNWQKHLYFKQFSLVKQL